ncbi:MAG: hypothetical protein B7Z36_05460 [Novosphingobium sp. 12-63-9]|nr:MAG: hypothetical protein B7Z36_05460 [Novosphingobium sp. 12-63-9]
MRVPFRFACLVSLLATSGAIAADMLPLKKGIYVPVGRACKGASNAEIVNYWGGKSSIGAAQGECTIKRLTHKGNLYTLNDVCRDIQSGDEIVGGPTVLRISNPSNFRMSGTNYRYCGTKVQF